MKTVEEKKKRCEYMKEWQAKNKEKAAAWKLKGQQLTRRAMLDDLGGKCVQCGFEDWRALQVDHIHGDGRKDIYRYGSRYLYAKIVAENHDKYQLLCANCNWIKRYENKEHGYRKDED